MEWQPIETAPKDSTCVLVITAGKDTRATIAYYQDDKYAQKPRPYWQRVSFLNSVLQCRSCPPTHWMPLPPPPAPPTAT